MRAVAVVVIFSVLVLLGAALRWDAPTSVVSQVPPPTGQPSAGEQGYPSLPLAARPIVDPAPASLAAVFAPWYGYDAGGNCAGGLESYHWNNHPDMAGVLDVPAKGYYCSADPDVLRWQLDLLHGIGVKALFVSWWGWGDGNLDGDREDAVDNHPDVHMNRGISALLDELITSSRPISVSLIVEPFPLTQAGVDVTRLTTAQTDLIYRRLDEYYDNPAYQDVWFRWPPSSSAKPLVITFDPLTLPPHSGYTLRSWTGGPRPPAGAPSPWDWYFAPEQDIAARVSRDGVAFVYPRFDEYPLAYPCPCTGEYRVPGRCVNQNACPGEGASYLTWPPRRIDPWLKQCAYARQWQRLAQYRDEIGLIVLYGWNLYGEQAYIEPAIAAPPRPSIGHGYVDKTREYYQAFSAGQPVPQLGYCPGYLPFVAK